MLLKSDTEENLRPMQNEKSHYSDTRQLSSTGRGSSPGI